VGGRETRAGSPHRPCRTQMSVISALGCSTVDTDLRALKERVAEITDLYSSLRLLDWDQKVTMPPGGHTARAEALATLARIHHERLVEDEMGRLLDRLRPLEESLD
jgi:Zn-dependent M32 family carboxypeptidase